MLNSKSKQNFYSFLLNVTTFFSTAAQGNVGIGLVNNMWGRRGILAVGGGYDPPGQDWNWNPVIQLWTVNQTTIPITFTKEVEVQWLV